MLNATEAREALARHLEAMYAGGVSSDRGAAALAELEAQAEMSALYELADGIGAVRQLLEAGELPTVIVLGRQYAASPGDELTAFSASGDSIGVYTRAEVQRLGTVELRDPVRVP